ncbi:MAG TPA: hypothetical protein VGE63_00725 [Candidatus Paceibacterota bacterium]
MNTPTKSASLVRQIATLAGIVVLVFAMAMSSADAQSVRRVFVTLPDGTATDMTITEAYQRNLVNTMNGQSGQTGIGGRKALATTVNAEGVTTSSATMVGIVRPADGCVAGTATQGFEFGYGSEWTKASPRVEDVNDGVIMYTLRDVPAGKTYSYRAWVTDCTGTTYGSTRSVTTRVPAPAVTVPAQAIDGGSVVVPAGTSTEDTKKDTSRIDFGNLFNKKDSTDSETTTPTTETKKADVKTETKADAKAEDAAVETEAAPKKKGGFFQWLLKGNTSEAPADTEETPTASSNS